MEPRVLPDRAWENESLWHGGWWEVIALVALFFVFAGGPPPSVNEAHYLVKAKHYWQPDWCGPDVFLDSADVHLVFYWLFGWLTRVVSLTATAWIVRLASWLLLAFAWQRLSRLLVPDRWASVVSAGLFLLFVQWFHLAGEWVVGGAEAKPFAFALVLLALRSIVLGQWRAVWLWLGGATALHVLVGGWSVLAAGFCWLLAGRQRFRWTSMLPALAAGAALALLGVVPALLMTRGTAPDVASAADRIYVFGRLSHHLVFTRFAALRMELFGALLTLWTALCWLLRSASRWRTLNRFAVATLLFSVCGVVIAYATAEHQDLAAGLLKFYWFRLADFAVPMSVSLGCVVLCQRWSAAWPRLGRVAWTLAVLAPALMIGKQYVELQLDFRPGAERQSRSVGRQSAEQAVRRYRAWREVCDWIQHQTPPDSRFLTPRNQQTFKWYAHRAELACWKDIPQDPESIVLWWKTFRIVYTPKVNRKGLGLWTDRSLVQFARRHEIDYIVVDRDRTSRALGLPRIYPSPFRGHGNRKPDSVFEVYRVPP